MILSEPVKTGKGRLPNVGGLRGLRIPENDQSAAKTAAFSVSVGIAVSSLPWVRHLNKLPPFCYTALDSKAIRHTVTSEWQAE